MLLIRKRIRKSEQKKLNKACILQNSILYYM